ncbi:glutaminase liver isoform, mitochondrial-like [Boleophthalmus pectinirostris]|uniref:glutaminase liver isoform, mitochondrial-like n=1 Tax=Boleophthalmus pectinirostris TaxID=150288 RepID=UPI0024330EB2|nr:glutaminase liver isoform, mitochondrial-like [Boleophthalmus pectinirostris]
MEKSQGQEPEDPSYLCFQRTPSLRRKWRKRYGGLDGNKLLEPSKDQDSTEEGAVKDECQTRSSVTQEVSQDATGAPRPAPRLLQPLTPLQRPVSLVFPGSAAPPVCSSNGYLKPPLPQALVSPEDRVPPQSWLSPVQSPSKRKAAADVLFDSFSTNGRINVNHFFESIWSSGLQRSDPRLRESFFHMRKLQDSDGTIDKNSFHRCVTGSVSLILKALQGRFVIPDFSTFTEETQKLFSSCKQLSSSSAQEKENDGADSVKWGVSICTVDGQRLSLGDWSSPVVLGELMWPLVYGVAVDLLGADLVHRYVGFEEFSRYNSPFTLNNSGVPHTPLTETGAIVTTSLLQLAGRLCAEEEEKYDSVLNVIRRLCNKEHANLNCTSYNSSRDSSVRLSALSFYLQDKKCFPEKVDINAALDLMLQCSSTEVTCESGAAMAASLANGGLCPLSCDQVLSPAATRCLLSVMQTAGLKHHSTAFHFKTSVPAASSSHGALLAVVPGVLGLMAFSPETDSRGNPWRALHFCQELVSRFQLHSFDIRTPFRQVLAYRQWKSESEVSPMIPHHCSIGPILATISFPRVLGGVIQLYAFMWGSSPLHEARRHNRDAAVQILQTTSTPDSSSPLSS